MMCIGFWKALKKHCLLEVDSADLLMAAQGDKEDT